MINPDDTPLGRYKKRRQSEKTMEKALGFDEIPSSSSSRTPYLHSTKRRSNTGRSYSGRSSSYSGRSSSRSQAPYDDEADKRRRAREQARQEELLYRTGTPEQIRAYEAMKELLRIETGQLVASRRRQDGLNYLRASADWEFFQKTII